MPNINMITSVISEYGAGWAVNRSLYSLKLKIMKAIPATERWYERKTRYPQRLDLFSVDLISLKGFIQELDDEDKLELIRIADQACEGIINGFSSINLDYGNPLDWQLSPLTGKRCSEKQKWYKIPDFDKERGDIKVIWEASRFSHFISLARAYLLTEDKKYYRAFSNQLKDWLEKNPYSYGANFKCSQECSFRMVNALLAFTVFNGSGVTTDADAANVKDLVDRCYRKILSNFFYAYRCIKNNHTVSELMGMIVGAWCCKDQKQLEKGFRLLDEVIDEQFTDDGGYRQFSFTYQRLALQDLECVLSIEGRAGRGLSRLSKDKLRNAAMLLYQCQDESGDMPNYGSNDGALIFPVTSCCYRDFRPVINTSYALAAGNRLYDGGKHQEELIWFSGGKKLSEYEVCKCDRVSSQFAGAGMFTIRERKSWAMVISNDYHSRPAHMDQLHIDLWIDGVNVLCDAGTYSYASDEGIKLARNESHNTAAAEGAPQMNSIGPFMIYDWTRRRLGACSDDVFEGKCVSANGYTHARKVKKIGSSYAITDKVDKDYIVYFHTPCNVEIAGSTAQLLRDGRKLCEIQTSGEIELQNCQRSLFYLRQEEITCISIKGKAEQTIKTKIGITEGVKER